MGIPGFYGQWLRKDVKEAVKTDGVPKFVSSLSFDLNGVLHEARKRVYGDGDMDIRGQQALAKTDPIQLEIQMQNAIASIILNMVQIIKPRDCLILAVDGVAPAAKIQQQRGRREKAAKSKSPLEVFDRNAITPGTDFMIRLDRFLTLFISSTSDKKVNKEENSKEPNDYLPPKIIYSSHMVPGEGEHKIMDYYRSGELEKGPAAKQGGAHILYGLDADLIMLSILSPLRNVFLARETTDEVVNIDRLREYISKNGGKRSSAVDDFVVMTSLIGNDFLPHITSLAELADSINLLLNIYRSGDFVLTKNGAIHWHDMNKFLKALAVKEPNLLAEIAVKEYKYPYQTLKGAIVEGQFYPKLFRNNWYENALGVRGTKVLYDKLISIANDFKGNETDKILHRKINPIKEYRLVTEARIQQMALDYLKTLSWVYLYYKGGTKAVNQEWYYPYHHAPMMVDISNVTNYELITGFSKFEGMIGFTVLHQLVAVTPLKSKEILPAELQVLYTYNSYIRDIHPEDFIIELDGKNKDHEGVPIVPLIDRTRIFDAVGQITFTVEKAKQYVEASDEVFIRSEEKAQMIAKLEQAKQRRQQRLERERQPTTQPTYARQPQERTQERYQQPQERYQQPQERYQQPQERYQPPAQSKSNVGGPNVGGPIMRPPTTEFKPREQSFVPQPSTFKFAPTSTKQQEQRKIPILPFIPLDDYLDSNIRICNPKSPKNVQTTQPPQYQPSVSKPIPPQPSQYQSSRTYTKPSQIVLPKVALSPKKREEKSWNDSSNLM
jgi:5'-3' exoribonuclease 1